MYLRTLSTIYVKSFQNFKLILSRLNVLFSKTIYKHCCCTVFVRYLRIYHLLLKDGHEKKIPKVTNVPGTTVVMSNHSSNHWHQIEPTNLCTSTVLNDMVWNVDLLDAVENFNELLPVFRNFIRKRREFH